MIAIVVSLPDMDLP